MASLILGHLPSLWRQHLLSEFAGLKQACPEGVFVSLTPGDPSLWSAVLFVRHGPYAPAVLRFQISFPDSYPRVPPLVTFSTDIFHPLITPLTTHMHTTDLQDDGTGTATEQERLAPGGFSLRHGFPEWSRRERRTTNKSRQTSDEHLDAASSSSSLSKKQSKSRSASPKTTTTSLPRYMQTNKKTVSTYSLLKYIRSTFDKVEVLDSIPLHAAGNPGAWHAWRTHRRKQGKVFEDRSAADGGGGGGGGGEQAKKEEGEQGQTHSSEKRKSVSSQTSTTRQPGEWNWDGVWEDRVRKGVASSLSDSVLYGPSGAPDDLIHFLALEEGDIEAVKGNLRRTLDATA